VGCSARGWRTSAARGPAAGPCCGGAGRSAAVGDRVREEKKRKTAGVIFTGFAECQIASTRQRIFLKFKNIFCRVPRIWHSAKTSLPSADRQALDKH
jgi:hypothetical protein